MIIIGYQGIGKSTLAGKYRYIDLESGNFWRCDETTGHAVRYDYWYISYCQIAEHLSQQGFDVFVSSHEVVRKQLRNSKEDVVVIFPSIHLKEYWIDKLRVRYEHSGLVKDYKAYMNAVDRYEENINEINNQEFEAGKIIRYEIGRIDYSLEDIIKEIKENLEYRKRDRKYVEE